MSRPRQFGNPFYVLLILVGILFVITACGYAVLATRGYAAPMTSGADTGSSASFLQWMDRYGLMALTIELAVLAVATVAAIGTDGYWERRRDRTGETPTHRKASVLEESPGENPGPRA